MDWSWDEIGPDRQLGDFAIIQDTADEALTLKEEILIIWKWKTT